MDEPNQALACLLRGKEAFAAAAFRDALHGVLNLDELYPKQEDRDVK